MNLISLDLSTKPGWAIFIDKKLVRFGTLFADTKAEDHGHYPFNYVLLAEHVALRLQKEVVEPGLALGADMTFVVEETTSSHAALSQKKVEFIHYATLKMLTALGQNKVYYVRTGSWRSAAGVKFSTEEKELNKKIKDYKKNTKEKLAKLDLSGSGKLTVVGKIGFKHVALRRVKEEFDIALAVKYEDAAEAILIGLGFLKGVKLCEGAISSQAKLKKAKLTQFAVRKKTF